MIYKAERGSGDAVLKEGVGVTDNIISVVNKEYIPTGPSILTLGEGVGSESIYYTNVTETGILEGVKRGYGGSTAKEWDAGAIVRRNLTSIEWNRLVDDLYNIKGYVDTIITEGGNVISIERSDGIDLVQKFIYNYDEAGKLVSEIVEKYSEGQLIYKTKRSIIYDNNEEVISITCEVL